MGAPTFRSPWAHPTSWDPFRAHWAADCREFHPHGRDNDDGEGLEEENEPSRPSSPPPFSTPARSAPRSTTRACSAPANAVRASAKREPPVKDDVEEAKTPLFREDGEVSPLSRPRKRPTHLVSPRTPGPDASSSRVSPPSTAGSISSVSSLSASVGSSASRTAPPLRSLPQYPPSSRPAAPHLHAGGSTSAGAGAQSRRHAELPVLFNNSTRTLYKDAATAVREMGKEDSIQVLEVEDLEEFSRARHVRWKAICVMANNAKGLDLVLLLFSYYLTATRTQMASEDDNEDANSEAERDTPAPARRIIDVQLDDGDDDWEDDVPTLGTSTHRSRNPRQPRIPIQKQHRRVRLGGDLDAIDVELAEHTDRLSTKYSMKPNDVRRRLLASSSYKPQRKPSLYNAKISVLMAELNADREGGNRLSIPQVKAMVKDDPSLLEGYTPEEEAEMLADLTAKREHKHHGTRANNIAANVDIRRTMARLVQELNGMAQRANMVGFAMFSQGHLHDTSTPTTISMGGALDFFRDVLKKDPADVSALFELWAVNREQGGKGPNTLLAMQKECTDIILTGLKAVTKQTKTAMNYENYIKSMVERKNIGLVGWPQEVAFKRMSLQSALPPLMILRDALNVGTCHWKVLTPTERQRILANFEDMVEKGEVQVKAKTARKSSRAATKKSSAKRRRDESSEESSDEDESGSERALRGRGGAVRDKLLALVQAKKAKGTVKEVKRKGKGDGDARPTKRTRAAGAQDEETSANSKKTRVRARNEDAPVKPKKSSAGKDEAPAKRKEKKTSAGNGQPPTKKRKTNAGEDDGKPPAKKRWGRRRRAPRKEAQEDGGQEGRACRACGGKAEAAAKVSLQEACRACALCIPDPTLACCLSPTRLSQSR
ncbi:hypothetical protein B0H13DRAFT_2379764 [Mycena leptocephala]|nr:hypothetical protein B0H13DRAFT_2379764 [Mycena leptocephala]